MTICYFCKCECLNVLVYQHEKDNLWKTSETRGPQQCGKVQPMPVNNPLLQDIYNVAAACSESGCVCVCLSITMVFKRSTWWFR